MERAAVGCVVDAMLLQESLVQPGASISRLDVLSCGSHSMVSVPCEFISFKSYIVKDPVDNGSEESVARCAMGKARYVGEHAVRDHLLSFGYCFVFLDRIGHDFNVI